MGMVTIPREEIEEFKIAGSNQSAPSVAIAEPSYTIGDPPGLDLTNGTPAVVESTTSAESTSKQIFSQPSNFPSVSGGVQIGPVGSLTPGMIIGKSKEEQIQERLAEYEPEKIHEFIRSNRKTITDLEEMIINLLKDADLMSYEVLKPMMMAKEAAYRMIEHALSTLHERCTPVDFHPETARKIGLGGSGLTRMVNLAMGTGGSVTCGK